MEWGRGPLPSQPLPFRKCQGFDPTSHGSIVPLPEHPSESKCIESHLTITVTERKQLIKSSRRNEVLIMIHLHDLMDVGHFSLHPTPTPLRHENPHLFYLEKYPDVSFLSILISPNMCWNNYQLQYAQFSDRTPIFEQDI